MNAVKAIFIKQLNDLLKNPTVTIMFLLFPVMAFIQVRFMAQYPEDARMIVASLAIMSVAAMPIMGIASYIAEDVEYRSLRFLIMAGVKPAQYLLGLAIFILILTALAMVAFGIIGNFTGEDLLVFVGITMLGSLVSLSVGAFVGLISKSVQQANTYATVLMMLLGFLPVLAQFNPDFINFTYYLFTQQISLLLTYTALGGGEIAIEFFNYVGVNDINFLRSSLIILANAAVFIGLFIYVYKKKGLGGE